METTIEQWLISLLRKLGIPEIPSKSVTNGQWFLWSSIKGIDVEEMRNKGLFFQVQDTIWTKHLEIMRCNPYWQIHNKFVTVYLIDSEDEIGKFYTQLEEIITSIKDFYEIDMLCVTTDFGITKIFQNKNKSVIRLELPMFVNKKKTGKYSKIYCRNRNYCPLFEITEYYVDNTKIREICFDLSHFEFAINYYKYNGIFVNLEKFKTARDIFHDELNQISQNQISTNSIRLFSLFEALQFLNNYEIEVSNSFVGHVYKKIIKNFALSLIQANISHDEMNGLLNSGILKMLKLEMDRISKIDKSILSNFDSKKLKETYGISIELQKYLLGENKRYFSIETANDIEYFSDFPFSCEKITDESFRECLYRIALNRRMRQ